MELIIDFLKVIGGVSILGYLSRLMAQQVFKKNMADYQGEITKELEKLKLQQQKNFKDFELFTSKKHEKYPEMYFHLETAYGHISSLEGNVEALTFENFDEEDLNLHFDELKMTSFDRARIIKLWRNYEGKQSAIREIQKIGRVINYRRADEKWREANNYYYFNLLYFSDVVSKSCKDLIDHQREYLNFLNPKYDFISSEETRAKTEIKNMIPGIRNSVKTEMQKELRIE
ncbi:hypothetical protein ACIQXQ_20670 [Peribacillus sp. NPDC097198]|uniref:hypothetical protein n=1 Tax=Peribacillus sp. NPDC097198 TaxID=3364397 RepID=UPI00381345C8